MVLTYFHINKTNNIEKVYCDVKFTFICTLITNFRKKIIRSLSVMERF